MTSRFRHNATFAVALICLSIAVFFAIFWYLAMSTNVFHAQSNTSTYRINVNNVNVNKSYQQQYHHQHGATTPGPGLTPSSAVPTESRTASLNLNDCTLARGVNFFDPDLLQGVTDFECVKPIKMHKKSLHTDDLLYESKNNGSGHNESAADHFTGEFRKTSSLIWDPHPQYTIEAFGQNMRLDLYNDGSFIHKDLKITHAWPNETLRRQTDHDDHDQIRGCFYRGQVYADAASTVSVSLCNGMTGQIRTHRGTFMIRPVEKYAEDKRSILHIIYRLESPSRGDYIDDILHNGNGGSSSNPSGDLMRNNLPDSNAIDSFDVRGNFVESSLHKSDDVSEISSHSIRRKRSLHGNNNNEYTMEILVAVDRKMQEYHGEETRNYVLTLMSIVSNIFADASIGNSISIAVVHIMFLKENVAHDAKGIGVEASKMLVDFCRIKNEKFKHDHDTALLLTREQICRSPSETKCDTLGLAELGTICRKESCSLVQDNGLSAAFTIAHELGHILNMPHDDDSKCNQFYGNQKKEHFIMSRMLGKNTHPWAWSNCSRHFATEYLENNHGLCMLNTPTHGVIEPNTGNSKLAGEKFNEHQQCELVYGPGSKICPYMPECNSLWCVTSGDKPDEGCRSQAMPWADGTPCGGHGSNKWCQKANCVYRNRNALRPVDGGWGHWSPWSDCSLQCGGGVQSSQRYCDSPAPANYGKYCTGNRVRYRSCNTDNCSPKMPDIRSQQCGIWDGNNFGVINKTDVKWVPKYGVSASDECKLYCRVKDNTLYFLLEPKVRDGTPCNQDRFSKCVNGHCHQAGCDNILYSDAVPDKCGVCNGKNDTCEDVNGSMTRNTLKRMVDAHPTSIYHRVTVIPKGALNIEIRQPGYPDDKSFIALRGENGENLLNAESSITNFPKEIAYGGLKFKYNGANQSMEMVTTKYATPLHKRVIVELLIVLQSKNDMRWFHGDQEIISYSYTMARENPHGGRTTSAPVVISAHNPFNHYGTSKRHHPPNYQWKISEYGSCDKLCYGKRIRTATCVNMDENRQVDHNYCSAHNRPNDESEDCNIDCDLSWSLKKSNCSTTCGEGHRTVEHVCIQKFKMHDRTNIVDDAYCPAIQNKIRKETCVGTCPDAYWEYGQWERCSQPCGGGNQNRTAYCLSHVGGTFVEHVYCHRIEKDDLRSCNNEPCPPEWVYDENAPCSVTCGEGFREKVLKCKQKDLLVNSSLCTHIPRPLTRPVPCAMPACAAKKVTVPQVQVMSMDDQSKTRHKDVYNVHPNSLYPSYHPKHSTPPPSIFNLKYEWKTGRWSNCTACGSAGKRQRSVLCTKSTGSHDYRYVDDQFCDIKMRPVNITSCADVNCFWNYGPWSECSDDCEITREVVCQNEKELLGNSQCDTTIKPTDRKTCCHIKWRSIWTACSGTCGFGERTRKKVCMKLMPKSSKNPHPIKTGKQLDESRCRGLTEPKYSILRRACRKPCVYYWKVSGWSQCDVGCGQGIARREVICTNGTTTSLTDCDTKKKPKKSTVCTSKDHCVWRLKKWKSMQCKCDGYQKVRPVCMDDLRKRRSTYCSEADRPAHKQRCTPNPPHCSCRDVRRRHIYRDGEYDMNVGGRNVSIYCHNMHSDSPKEYLTLRAGDTENYAFYMGNRSKLENVCPYEPEYMFRDETIPAGTTRFRKVRVKLNLDDLQVVDDDYEFALTSGRNQSFGSAGDCFSNRGDCPRGVFHINLEGTGLMISSRNEWIAEGVRSVLHFHTPLEAPYTKVVGRCGGFCGKCRPSSPLRLDVA